MNLVRLTPKPQTLLALLDSVAHALMCSQSLEYAETTAHLYRALCAYDHITARAWAHDNRDSVVPVVTAILFKSGQYGNWMRWYITTT